MIALSILRSSQTPDGVFGILSCGSLRLYTMEDDWKDNQPRESCIPHGTYTLRRTIYHKHNYETFEVTGVPNRSRILIHPANTEEDVEGCIGIGLRLGTLAVRDEDDPSHPLIEKQAVVASKEAFRTFMQALATEDTVELTIEWAVGLPKAAA